MSITHLILLFLILLLVFGPSRLESLGSSLGRAIRGFKKGLEEGSDTPSNNANNTPSSNNQKKDGDNGASGSTPT